MDGESALESTVAMLHGSEKALMTGQLDTLGGRGHGATLCHHSFRTVCSDVLHRCQMPLRVQPSLFQSTTLLPLNINKLKPESISWTLLPVSVSRTQAPYPRRVCPPSLSGSRSVISEGSSTNGL